jgi:hypothetical protein
MGTAPEYSMMEIRKWYLAIHLMTTHKGGMSSVALQRELSVTHKTAWQDGFKAYQAQTVQKECLHDFEVISPSAPDSKRKWRTRFQEHVRRIFWASIMSCAPDICKIIRRMFHATAPVLLRKQSPTIIACLFGAILRPHWQDLICGVIACLFSCPPRACLTQNPLKNTAIQAVSTRPY